MSLRLLKNIIVLVLSILLGSCATTRPPGHDVVLKRNALAFDIPTISSFDIEGFIQQKPSKRLLLSSNLNVWLNTYANKGKENGFKLWLKRAVVEKPVVLDTNLTNQACRQIKLYLNNIGYFHGNVLKTVKYKGKYAKVKYSLITGTPYRIRKIDYQISDTSIRKVLLHEMQNSLLSEGMIYSAYTLDEERNRVTTVLKNEGYYNFAREYINFKIDSSLKDNKMDILVNLNNPRVTSTSPPFELKEQKHLLYNVRNVIIYTDYDPLRSNNLKPDTLRYIFKVSPDTTGTTYTFISYGKIPVKPSTILHACFITPNKQYNLNDVNQTYIRLTDLQVFRYVNIDFKEISSTNTISVERKEVDCVIQLSRNMIQSFSMGMEGTNTGGDFGLSANPGYQNRNLFHGSELLSLRLKGAMEKQHRFGDIYFANNPKLFNTYELGVNASLVIPKFLVPFAPDRFSKYFRPKSTLNAGFNYLEMTSFKRYLTEVTFGYDWKDGKYSRHVFNPLEISSISIFTDSTFNAYINSLNDKRLQEQYTDHLIMALRYSFIYNNQQINKKSDFIYLKSDFESAGNLLTISNNLLGSTKDENGNYGISGIRYSQYVKTNVDFRYYHALRKSMLVFRAASGLGIPYGNSVALPFDKGFYAGGANGMRGWAIRSLGPGSFNSDNVSLQSERMGDLFIESNIEYRFQFSPILNGGLFTDMGNIWMLRKNDQYPGGEFRGDSFYKEIAIDAGFGIRFDFSFFVLRIDGALPVRNPALDESIRWIKMKQVSLTNVMWNLGIGYPF